MVTFRDKNNASNQAVVILTGGISLMPVNQPILNLLQYIRCHVQIRRNSIKATA